jgi:hypothetical protein
MNDDKDNMNNKKKTRYTQSDLFRGTILFIVIIWALWIMSTFYLYLAYGN